MQTQMSGLLLISDSYPVCSIWGILAVRRMAPRAITYYRIRDYVL